MNKTELFEFFCFIKENFDEVYKDNTINYEQDKEQDKVGADHELSANKSPVSKK